MWFGIKRAEAISEGLAVPIGSLRTPEDLGDLADAGVSGWETLPITKRMKSLFFFGFHMHGGL